MRKADLTVLDEVLDRVATATRRILELGPAAAMNEFNRRDGMARRKSNESTKPQRREPAGKAGNQGLT